MGIINLLTNIFSVNEDSGLANIPVIRSGNLDNTTKINFTTLPGSAVDGEDYIGNLAGILTFEPGQSIKTIQVPLINNTIPELDETFSVAIGEVLSLVIPPGQSPDEAGIPRTATITIKDNDVESGTESRIEFNLSDFSVLENQGKAEVVITKTPSTTPAIVNFRTSDDYAKSLTTKPEFKDYTGITTNVSFAPLETSKTLTIAIVNDNLSETDESLNLFLTNPVGAALGLRQNATVTIKNDDSLPGILTKETLVSDLQKPTGFAWGNNGYIYITETDGKIKVFDENTKTMLTLPFIDMTNQVNNQGQRGLLSFAIDPQFPAKPYLYLGYTYDSPEEVAKDGADSANLRTNRLVRITADPSTNFTTAIPNSEKVLMEIPNGANFHASAGLGFGLDGSLFWGHGDGAVVGSVIADPAKLLDLNYPFGKLFRINPENGAAYTDNPFYDPQNPNSYRSKVYSYGLRNPFRITINPTTGEPYIGDVGWNNWEEVNTGKGKNFGWPLYEGANGVSTRTPAYENNPKLQNYYNTLEVTAPVYGRNNKNNFVTIIMGPFYNANVYPSILKDSLFIGNFNGRTLEALQFDTTGTKVENSILVGSNLDVMPTQILLGPDGYLYATHYNYAKENGSSLVRWVFDQTLPKMTIADTSVIEGNILTTSASFVVTLDQTYHYNVVIDYIIEDLTTTSNIDYIQTSAQITFAPGVTTKTIQVSVMGDTLFERNENFLVKLRNPINATFIRSAALGTITNDDQPPRITISDSTILEGNTDKTSLDFVVSLTSPSALPLTLNYRTTDQSASSPSDYRATSAQITFAPGITNQTISVSINGDTLIENNETFTLNLSSSSNGVITDDTAIATILDDDTPPKISLSDTSIIEGNSGTTTAALKVSLDSVYGLPIILNYSTTPQTAFSDSDYQAISGQITFAPGTTVQSLAIPVISDTLFEKNESFLVRLRLTNSLHGTFARSAAIATILNDDPQPKITLSDTSVLEGNSTTTASFLVTLDSPSGLPVIVNYSTINQTAFSSSDYLLSTGSITFAIGTTLSTIQVPIIGDTLVERNESFLLRLTNPLNASFTRSAALGIIINDDSPITRLSANSGVRESKVLISSLRPPDVFVSDLNSSD